MLLSIQMIEFNRNSGQSLQKWYFFDMDEISSSSVEKLMFFYFDAHIDISCNYAGLNEFKSTY